ncbi:MAG: hypothetical protein HRU78_03675 [Gammaproteobacteria bacterium]|nr:MAG: hypothetical protein HRU78_03675 [Gammaproteobacteria bacterium]
MSLESAFESLQRMVTNLSEAVATLQIIVEDMPKKERPFLIDQLDDQVTDLLGILEEIDAHVLEAVQSSKSPDQSEQAQQALYKAHTSVNHFIAQYIGKIGTHDVIAKLLEMGNERGREWRKWSLEVKTALERCWVPLKMVSDELLHCWHELTQRMMRGLVFMQNTDIRQQVTVRENQSKLAGTAA